MKCVNMDVANVLFFTVNFIITICAANFRHNIMSSQLTSFKNEFRSNFDKDCPIIKKITESNLLNYTINCKKLNTRNLETNVESVLQYACFVVKNISSVLCYRNINVTADLLKIHDVTSVCPFDFLHLNQLGFTFNHPELLNELTDKNHCLIVCSDLHSVRTQCAILSKFNDYLKSVTHQLSKSSTQDYSVTLEHKLEQKQEEVAVAKHNNQKTESIITSTNQEQQQQPIEIDSKEITTTKANNETEVNKLVTISKNITKPDTEEKIRKPISSSTPKEKQKLNEVKTSNKESDKQNNDELKTNIDGGSEEFTGNHAFQDSFTRSFNVKPELSKEETIPKEEIFEDKISDFTSKGKEIYAGDGFFQAEDSHFFFYFIMVSSIIVVGYLAFHNKNKILAYALEGTSGRHSRRRPNPARYRKLETNLEEAILSNTTNAAASVVY